MGSDGFSELIRMRDDPKPAESVLNPIQPLAWGNAEPTQAQAGCPWPDVRAP